MELISFLVIPAKTNVDSVVIFLKCDPGMLFFMRL